MTFSLGVVLTHTCIYRGVHAEDDQLFHAFDQSFWQILSLLNLKEAETVNVSKFGLIFESFSCYFVKLYPFKKAYKCCCSAAPDGYLLIPVDAAMMDLVFQTQFLPFWFNVD
ncbi:hypothetical protein AMECASPLE_009008 [Ameca splendens]|uniref:Uncharacterized protein n=1 Tax=Ameca splendens TaxID=208324 RepID=A0ABV0YYP9_9TELE